MAHPHDDLGTCTALLRQDWRDMYLANLLLPDASRPLATALYGFHNEIVKAMAQVREPMAGEVRLQWWREVLQGDRAGEADGNPLARLLLSQLSAFDLDASPLIAKCDAHIFDLYQDPMADRTMLEGYCGETRSVLLQMLAMGAGASAGQVSNASGHGGVAQGVLAICYNLEAARRAGQCYVPRDLLVACGMAVEDFLAADTADVAPVLAGLLDLATDHLSKASEARGNLPESLQTVYKPLALTALDLAHARKQGVALLTSPKRTGLLRRQWALWRG
ncbi:MAG: squalene/phytoene synthase family protein [Pseudomonadota bacterium]